MSRAERHTGLELYRLMAAMAVMMIHYCITDCAAAVWHAGQGESLVNFWLLIFLQGCSMWAVDGFVLLSGYHLCRTNRRTLLKPFMLLTEFSVLMGAAYVVRTTVEGGFTLPGLLKSLVPAQYFVMLYIALYLLSPALNVVIARADKRGWRRLLIAMLLILSLWPTLAELVFELRGTNPTHLSPIAFDADLDGQTLVNFALMYVLGGFLRTREEKLMRIPLWRLLLMLAGLWGLTFVWAVGNEFLPRNGFSSSFSYGNPLVVGAAVVLFLLMRRVRFHARWVNLLAGGCYTCFLMHYPILQASGAGQAALRPWWQLLAHAGLTLAGTYGLLWLVWLIWHALSAPVFRRMRKWRIFAEFELL